MVSQGRVPTPIVLVAEDEPTMLELIANHLRQLREPKLEVLEARDGDEAWSIAKDRLPDLVVLDVMMPGMSGWEVCRKIREDVALAHTGVVMLTGIGENLNQLTSPLYGADGYLDKGGAFSFDALDERVRDALDAHASQRMLNVVPKNGVGRHASAARLPSSKIVRNVTEKGSKRMAAKKTAAKKPAAKKPAAKKAAAKKPAAKKAAAKKPAAKKAAAKKPAAKKAAKK